MALSSAASKPQQGQISRLTSTAITNEEVIETGTFMTPDPENDPLKLALWQSQVLIPFQGLGKTYSYLGPYNPPPIINFYNSIFPLSPSNRILATSDSINAKFLTNTHSSYRTAWPLSKNNYNAWVDRVAEKK